MKNSAPSAVTLCALCGKSLSFFLRFRYPAPHRDQVVTNLRKDPIMPTTDTTERFDRLEPGLRDRILDAAAGEFFRFGFQAASMNRLVERAGISKGALFKYFGTKAGLFSFIYRVALDEVKGSLRRVRDETAGQPFFTRLERVLEAGLDLSTRRPMYAAIYYRVIYTGDSPHSREILEEIQGISRKFLASLVEEGIENGDLRQDLHPQRAAFIIQSVLDRFLQAHHLDFMSPMFDVKQGPSDVREGWVREIMTFFRKGMECDA